MPLHRNNNLDVDLKLLCSVQNKSVWWWFVRRSAVREIRGIPVWNQTGVCHHFLLRIVSWHKKKKKNVMDLRSLGAPCPATVVLRRSIKGQTHILSAVHWASICLTPDTFHSDAASCPARAASLLETFHQSLYVKTLKSPREEHAYTGSGHNKGNSDFICIPNFCIINTTAESAAIQFHYSNFYQHEFYFVLCPHLYSF